MLCSTNFPTVYKIGVETRFIPTTNLDISDRLIYGAIGKLFCMDIKRDSSLIDRFL